MVVNINCFRLFNVFRPIAGGRAHGITMPGDENVVIRHTFGFCLWLNFHLDQQPAVTTHYWPHWFDWHLLQTESTGRGY